MRLLAERVCEIQNTALLRTFSLFDLSRAMALSASTDLLLRTWLSAYVTDSVSSSARDGRSPTRVSTTASPSLPDWPSQKMASRRAFGFGEFLTMPNNIGIA